MLISAKGNRSIFIQRFNRKQMTRVGRHPYDSYRLPFLLINVIVRGLTIGGSTWGLGARVPLYNACPSSWDQTTNLATNSCHPNLPPTCQLLEPPGGNKEKTVILTLLHMISASFKQPTIKELNKFSSIKIHFL